MADRSSAVIDWDLLVYKNLRARDGEPVSNIVSVTDDDCILVETIESKRPRRHFLPV